MVVVDSDFKKTLDKSSPSELFRTFFYENRAIGVTSFLSLILHFSVSGFTKRCSAMCNRCAKKKGKRCGFFTSQTVIASSVATEREYCTVYSRTFF